MDDNETGAAPDDAAHVQPQPPNAMRNGAMPPYGALTPEQQQQMVYQQYMQSQHQQGVGQYPLPPQARKQIMVITSVADMQKVNNSFLENRKLSALWLYSIPITLITENMDLLL